MEGKPIKRVSSGAAISFMKESLLEQKEVEVKLIEEYEEELIVKYQRMNEEYLEKFGYANVLQELEDRIKEWGVKVGGNPFAFDPDELKTSEEKKAERKKEYLVEVTPPRKQWIFHDFA